MTEQRPGGGSARRRPAGTSPAATLGIAALVAAAAAAGCAGGPAGGAGAGGAAAAAASADAGGGPNAREWVQLFNGRDLTGWTMKFTGFDAGVNHNDTFRVEDGLLKVRYDKWSGFSGQFGHIFHERPFSYYVVAAEYRFVGEQVKGAGPQYAWALRNNGIMVHSQPVGTMGKDQDFPISIEVQLLGGLGRGPRTTANLCTPGTNVVMNDTVVTQHCINSASKTYEGDQWVRAEAMVLGDSVVKHIVNGDTVMTYHKPQMGGGAVANLRPGMMQPGRLISEGHIALQAETAEIDFRKVEVLDLRGCTDPKASNYKAYFVKSDQRACRYVRGGAPAGRE
jgi:hypothetical protein